MDRGDFNPRLLPCEDFLRKEIDWEGFRRFLSKSCCKITADERIRYGNKYYQCLLKEDFSILNTFSDSRREHTLKALSLLSKFLGIYDSFQALMKKFGVKWRTLYSDKLILSRMEKTRKNGNVIKWIIEVKQKFPKLLDFMDFVLISGLRLSEAISSYNLIIDLSKQGKLDTYYDKKKQVLEHYKFRSIFIRRTKKVFLSYIPQTFILKIWCNEKLLPYQVENWIRRSRFKSRFRDVREYYATFMTKFLNPAEIDFLQGRVSTTVFMRNYFNPALIGDLQERIFKGIFQLMKDLTIK
jgi:intergrase/recombinase